MHKTLLKFSLHGIEELFVGRSPKGNHRKDLGLAPSEHGGAMYARKRSHFCRKLPQFVMGSSVNPFPFLKTPGMHYLVCFFVENILERVDPCFFRSEFLSC